MGGNEGYTPYIFTYTSATTPPVKFRDEFGYIGKLRTNFTRHATHHSESLKLGSRVFGFPPHCLRDG
jgi:hypothetical protein